MTNAMYSIAVSAIDIGSTSGKNQILKSISVCFTHGRWTSIVGPNGAGKSTLLKVLAGLAPFEGAVELLGQPLQNLSSKQRAQQLSWLGQHESSADDLSAYDIAMLGRLPHQQWLATASAADHAAVENALRSTHAWEWRAKTFGQLSGGERQRVLLARALAVDAKVMLMDEPLANLDPPHQADWLALTKALVASGKTVISVLHEISFALQADEVVVLAGGCVMHQGACIDAASHRAIETVFDQRIAIYPLVGQWVSLPRI